MPLRLDECGWGDVLSVLGIFEVPLSIELIMTFLQRVS